MHRHAPSLLLSPDKAQKKKRLFKRFFKVLVSYSETACFESGNREA